MKAIVAVRLDSARSSTLEGASNRPRRFPIFVEREATSRHLLGLRAAPEFSRRQRLLSPNRAVSSSAAERCQPANRAGRSRVCSKKAVLERPSEAYREEWVVR